MILFFDTETTGIPKDYKAPVSDSQNWPRLVQIAWILTDNDGKQVEAASAIIRPDDFEIPEAAAKIHGITTAMAMAQGVSIRTALARFWEHCQNAAVNLVAGHNISFDDKIVRAEFHRLKWPDHLEGRTRVCTMMTSTKYCNLPGNYGPKWPKLQELHKKLFKEEFTEAHNAAADIQATVRCFFELRRLGVIKL